MHEEERKYQSVLVQQPTSYISAPASEDNFDRALVDQSKVHVPLLVHPNGPKIQR